MTIQIIQNISKYNINISNNEINFVIERSLTGTDGWRQIAVLAAGVTSYTDTGLTAVTTFHYRILAENGGGESDFSANTSVTTSAAPVPTSPPSNLAAAVNSFSEITLTWVDNSNDETSFVVERSLDGTTGWTTIATLPPETVEFQNFGITAETKYYYRVFANAPGGASVFSSVVSATTYTVAEGAGASGIDAIAVTIPNNSAARKFVRVVAIP